MQPISNMDEKCGRAHCVYVNPILQYMAMWWFTASTRLHTASVKGVNR